MLLRLREAKTMEQRSPASINGPQTLRFGSEEDCERYLIGRIERAGHRFARCKNRHGYWLMGRRRWQCARCGQQLGLRTGTVMEGSPLPLKSWFAAICSLLINPDLQTGSLAGATGIRRAATVRRMAARIRAAMASLGCSELLAGLDGIVRPSLSGDLNQAYSERVVLQNELCG